jgi:hypothetical protein
MAVQQHLDRVQGCHSQDMPVTSSSGPALSEWPSTLSKAGLWVQFSQHLIAKIEIKSVDAALWQALMP